MIRKVCLFISHVINNSLVLRWIIIISIPIILLFTSQHCKSPTEFIDNATPGRRDYTWTVDTLNLPVGSIVAVWGAAPNDVWAIGLGGTYTDRLLHYDGKKWTTYNKEIILCTGETLFGFSADDVWMGGGAGWEGRGAGIWHYDGNKWSKNFIYNVDSAWGVQVTDIWGSNPDDIYACGTIGYSQGTQDSWRGFVLHFNGAEWKEIVKADFNSQFLHIRQEQNKVYIFAIRTSTTVCDTVAFYKLENNKLKEIFSSPEDKITYGNLHLVNGNVYFLITQDVYRYIFGSFIKQFSLAHANFGYQFYGRNEKDLFLSMKDGVAHYNGTDIEYLYYFPLNRVSIIGEPMIFEKEVFFCLWDYTGGNFNNEILHGKLKE